MYMQTHQLGSQLPEPPRLGLLEVSLPAGKGWRQVGRVAQQPLRVRVDRRGKRAAVVVQDVCESTASISAFLPVTCCAYLAGCVMMST